MASKNVSAAAVRAPVPSGVRLRQVRRQEYQALDTGLVKHVRPTERLPHRVGADESGSVDVNAPDTSKYQSRLPVLGDEVDRDVRGRRVARSREVPVKPHPRSTFLAIVVDLSPFLACASLKVIVWHRHCSSCSGYACRCRRSDAALERRFEHRPGGVCRRRSAPPLSTRRSAWSVCSWRPATRDMRPRTSCRLSNRARASRSISLPLLSDRRELLQRRC